MSTRIQWNGDNVLPIPKADSNNNFRWILFHNRSAYHGSTPDPTPPSQLVILCRPQATRISTMAFLGGMRRPYQIHPNTSLRASEKADPQNLLPMLRRWVRQGN